MSCLQDINLQLVCTGVLAIPMLQLAVVTCSQMTMAARGHQLLKDIK